MTRSLVSVLTLSFLYALTACSSSDSGNANPGGSFGAVGDPSASTGGNNTGGPGASTGGSKATGGGTATGGSTTPAPQPGALCAACTKDVDCTGAGAMCLKNNNTGEMFCGNDCSSGASCPDGYKCVTLSGKVAGEQCAPNSESCKAPTSVGNGGAGSGTSGGTGDGQKDPACDAGFRGPFCANDKIIGFDAGPAGNPSATLEEVRQFSLSAVNYLRSRTCLPPLVLDSCLNKIGTTANEAIPSLGIHGYFIQNCMNQSHQFGSACECSWTQENYGMAGGSNRSWKEGVIVPLCAMMEEPFGQGHRGNIENTKWTRLGVGITYDSSSASWCHEFGVNP